MTSMIGTWLSKQFERAAFWPGLCVVISIVWLLKSKRGVEEFNAWVLGASVFVGILSGGVALTKRITQQKTQPPAAPGETPSVPPP